MPRRPRLTATLRTELAGRGFVVERSVRLSHSGDSPVFRLSLRDGQVVRVRVFPTEAAATTVWRLLKSVQPGVLAQPLGRVGPAILTEYVDGEPLDRHLRKDSQAAALRHVQAVGAMLAALHQRPARRRLWRPEDYRQLVSDVARRLERRRLVSGDTARRLVEIPMPATVRYSLTHGDACPENVVYERGGRLRLIDEERLAIRPTAFDLARTTTRWPLDRRMEAAFLMSYRNAGGDDRAYQSDRTFWLATALAVSAAYRLRRHLPGVRRASAALRALSHQSRD